MGYPQLAEYLGSQWPAKCNVMAESNGNIMLSMAISAENGNSISV
jgi:hypothetical protein